MIQQENDSIILSISPEQIISAVKKMKKKQKESFIEDLLASISPEYLKSIKEARKDYKEGHIYSHNEVFK